MPDLFGIDIAGEIAQAFSGQLVIGTLTKVVSGTRTPGNLTGGTNPTTSSHSFEGFIENRTNKRRDGTLVSSTGEFVTILGASVSPSAVPEQGDGINIESVDYRIIEITGRDPAAATYECRVER